MYVCVYAYIRGMSVVRMPGRNETSPLNVEKQLENCELSYP